MKKIDLVTELCLTNEEMCSIIVDEVSSIDNTKALDMILDCLEQLEPTEKEKYKKLPLIYQITWIAREMYKFGIMKALHCYNEVLKSSINDLEKER